MDGKAYKIAGVDIDRANTFVELIKPKVREALRPEVMGSIGGFGGLFRLDIKKYRNPILVSSTDGVGTKLKIAQKFDVHETVGIDLVAMSVNDIVVQGAEPLFFLDYLATGELDVTRSVKIVEGIVKGCQEAGCALLGGETAEMPGMYSGGEYDLAGFCVGIVEAEGLIDGSTIHVGDTIVGLASSGLHSNGFSLVRRIVFQEKKFTGKERIEGYAEPLKNVLLTPTRIYVKPILVLLKSFAIRGMVHITGGGFYDNIPRILPQGTQAHITKGTWPIPPIFTHLQEWGKVEEKEMYRVFNMGIGMMLIVKPEDAPEIIARLENMGEKAYIIGSIKMRKEGEPSVVLA
ncbi:MAG TPA: phosphoribosylformylglycinamidine cyclo-ligase [Syntrophales bacterium]|nr:phosphoribosylformylglycinamidine cyclo-ligase [Syntrophales bacterium]HOL58535.1 phosphoribosylformylglycinamidine cyclo-ligase [Syntrophales bacterium]HPO34857.1 phosphoribosylformylglycinamidine cyclo-ligase [Syntrophales bacterium]